MSSGAKPRVWIPVAPVIVALALMGAHALLLRVMAREQVAARLFSTSSEAASGDLLLAIVFLGLRLLVYLVVPGLLLHGIWGILRGGVGMFRSRARSDE